MTVPADPDHGKAEKLVQSRPDRPDAPGGRATQDAAQAVAATDAMPVAPDGTTATPEEASPTAKPGIETPLAEQTYTTASGRTVQVSATGAIPTAQKKKPRKGVRALTTVIFVGVVLLFVALAAVVVMVLIQSDQPQGYVPPEEVEAAGTYDGQTNPFLAETATFLGLSLDEPVVIAIDASIDSSRWLDMVKQCVIQTAAHTPSTDAQLIFWTQQDPKVWPEAGPQPLSANSQALDKHLASANAQGQTDPIPALQAAFAVEPDQIILVTGQFLPMNKEREMASLIEAHPDVRVDAVIFHAEGLPFLRNAVEASRGHYVPLTVSKLRQWKQEAGND